MGPTESEILNQVTQKTHSELILFFIVVAVVLVIFLLPLYTMMMNDRKERRKAEQARKEAEVKGESDRLDRYIQREAQIIQVVTQNTEVIAGLKVTLEQSGIATSNSLARINDRIDASIKSNERVLLETEILKTHMEAVKTTQGSLLDTMQKTLLIVDSLPHGSNFHAD